MVYDAGLAANRAATLAFIAVSPISLVLTPRTEEPDGTGGRMRVDGTPRDAQTFSLLEPGNSGYTEPVVRDDGQQYTIDFMLLGAHDSLMAAEDYFTVDGKDYRLLVLLPDNGYERRALVVQHGV